jgi:hypothetical protein
MASFMWVLLLEVQRLSRGECIQICRKRGGMRGARIRMRMRKAARWEDGGRNERGKIAHRQMMLAGGTTGDASARLRTGCWSAVLGRRGILRVLPLGGARSAKLTVEYCCTLPACAS